jgi:rod shape determining protein RodA
MPCLLNISSWVPSLRIDYKLEDKFDVGLFASFLALFIIGVAAIYSSTLHNHAASGNFEKQMFWGLAGLFVFFIVYYLPTTAFRQIAVPSYLLSLLFLVLVLLIGRRIYGQRSWFGFGSFGFQPSEFAKIGTILGLAYFMSRRNMNIETFKDIFLSLGIGLFPVGLIFLEPDMGTSFVFFALILIMVFWKGISLFGLFVVLSPGIVALSSLFGPLYFVFTMLLVVTALILFKKDIFFSGAILALNMGAGFFTDYVYRALSPHQQSRILTFINPGSDPLGSGYNAIQAKVAIGSGGLLGKGFLNGNQTQLQYIPEQWTDFIFCVIGEEFGFIGAFIVLVLFLYIFLRIIKIASLTKDEFISLTLIGILSVYFVHVVVNIGMVTGLIPVIGIPLPFVSYGGSSLLVNMLMLGIVANIYRTRKNYI